MTGTEKTPKFEGTEYCAARVAVAQKEQAIEEALDHHFGTHNWPMPEVAECARMIYYDDGREVFTMRGIELLEFLPMQSNIEIDELTVRIQVNIPFRRLYES